MLITFVHYFYVSFCSLNSFSTRRRKKLKKQITRKWNYSLTQHMKTSSFYTDREHKNEISDEKSITRFCLQGEVILGRWKIKSTVSRLASKSKYDAVFEESLWEIFVIVVGLNGFFWCFEVVVRGNWCWGWKKSKGRNEFENLWCWKMNKNEIFYC